jgi:2-dehydro-3-deoxyphosphooctonate aldolase (KDO 8-P synthase)
MSQRADPKPLLLIAGPCLAESETLCLEMAETLSALADELGMPFVFKASYDKANRTSLASERGPGLEEGLRILAKVRQQVGCKVLSDVHEVAQLARAAEVLDILQVPAFLSRQTDLLIAAGKSGKPVNIKKGQFLAPWDMAHAIEKVRSTGNEKIMVTERGASFGYNNLVVDMRSLAILRGFGYPVIFDATHSVQLPSGAGGASGGQREFVLPLARAAAGAGIDGIFFETHPDPDRALCDGPNMVPLSELPGVLEQVLAVHEAVSGFT